jgi:excisionase family DNA binding protein
MADIERLLQPKEVGEVLGLRRSKVHNMIATGDIPSVIVSQGTRRRVFRVRPSELAKWMKAREVGNGR